MNACQLTIRLMFLTCLIAASLDAHFYGIVEKPSKFESKQDFMDYMLKLNQHNAITGKLGTTRYGKRSFEIQNVNADELPNRDEQINNIFDMIENKNGLIIEKIKKLLDQLE